MSYPKEENNLNGYLALILRTVHKHRSFTALDFRSGSRSGSPVKINEPCHFNDVP